MQSQLSIEDILGHFDYRAKSTAEKFLETKVEIKGSTFDISKANINRRPGHIGFVDVLVAIPIDLKGADEIPLTTTYNEQYERFEEYTLAIWRYNRARTDRFSWEDAEELCKGCRDSEKVIPIRIYLDSGFKPQQVVEYLKC